MVGGGVAQRRDATTALRLSTAGLAKGAYVCIISSRLDRQCWVRAGAPL